MKRLVADRPDRRGGVHARRAPRRARRSTTRASACSRRASYDGAEKALLDARSNAGVDPELRFRAAYDLGMAYAAHADKVKTDKDARPREGARARAAGGVVVRRCGASCARTTATPQANLATVRARAAGARRRAAQGRRQARGAARQADRRAAQASSSDARGAWVAIKQAGGADPLAQQGTLTHLADHERGIVAEAGVIGDIADDEIDAIGKKAEDKRSDEEKARVVQLKNLDLYLVDARARIAEARRKLQDLAAEDGVDRAEAALVALKRAREQLLDPIDVLARGRAATRSSCSRRPAPSRRPTTGEARGQRGRAAAADPGVDGAAGARRSPGRPARSRRGSARARRAGDRARRRSAGIEAASRRRLLERVQGRAAARRRGERRDGHARTALDRRRSWPTPRLAERDALIALAQGDRAVRRPQADDRHHVATRQKQLVTLLSPEAKKRAASARADQGCARARTSRAWRGSRS